MLEHEQTLTPLEHPIEELSAQSTEKEFAIALS